MGDTFKVTAMNSDASAASLLQGIFSPIVSLHYGGLLSGRSSRAPSTVAALKAGRWSCRKEVEQKERGNLLQTPFAFKTTARIKGHRARFLLCWISKAVWWKSVTLHSAMHLGHKIGNVFEVDPFNVGGACCFLYTQFYHYIHVLLSGINARLGNRTTFEVNGECPDTYDARLPNKLYLVKR